MTVRERDSSRYKHNVGMMIILYYKEITEMTFLIMFTSCSNLVFELVF